MTNAEITNANIKSCGYEIGKSIRGKGTEILSTPSYVSSSWYLDTDNEDEKSKEIKKVIEKVNDIGIDNVYVKEIKINTNRGVQRFNYDKNYQLSLSKFNLREIIKNNFMHIEYISVYTIPVLLCHIPITKFKGDFESQQEMIKELSLRADNVKIVGDLYEQAYYESYDNDNIISFSSFNGNNDKWGYNGDYTLYHGPYVCYDDAEKIDCRISNYNDSVVDDFWNLTMEDEDPFEWIDPDNKVSVYARKGKDWYVTSGLEEIDISLTYKDEDGELIEEEGYSFLVELADLELVSKIEDQVRSMKYDVELHGFINNELKIGNYYDESIYNYNKNVFNLLILKKEYGDDWSYDFREDLESIIDYNTIGNEEDIIIEAYEKYLTNHMDSDNKLFGKYKHFNMLKQIVENEGKNLVYTEDYLGSNKMRWALKYKNEEYHFPLSNLFDSNPKDFYKYISKQLTKRTVEKKEIQDVMERAKNVFVGINDSIEGGNCEAGTRSFCSKFNIDTKKTGGIRGDYLLSLDYSSFTRRAVIQAINRQKV